MLLPDLEQVASHSLSSGPHAFVLPYTSMPYSLKTLADRRRMPIFLKDVSRGGKGIKKG